MQEVMCNPAVVSCTDGLSNNSLDNRLDTLQKYLQEIGCFPSLSKKEQLYYSRLGQSGNQKAKEHLIKCNLKLVVFIAKNYQHRGVSLQDLIEEGNLGLLRAVDKFDPDLGFCFSTYATYWVRHKVERAVMQQNKIVRTPINKQKETNLYLRKAYQYQQATGHWPKPEQIITDDPKQLSRIKKNLANRVMPISLDAPIGNDDDSQLTVADTLRVEEAQCDYSYAIDAKAVIKKLLQGLSQLSNKQKSIIIMRYGLEEEPGKTLEEIAKHLSLSRERVRQLQNQGLIVLRKHLEEQGLNSDSIPLP